MVFLLLGLTVDLANLAMQAWPVIVAIAAVLLIRLVTIEALGIVPGGALVKSAAERFVLAWGGLRGALTAALALALPADMAGRELLIAMAFGVVLFTLIVQGATLRVVLRRLGLSLAEAEPQNPSG
jgi:CPA1 family monovalent cation:H+ antiporter